MPKFTNVYAALPASDLERAKAWYVEKMGLTPVDESDLAIYFEVGSSRFFVFPTEFAGTNQATGATFEVEDVEGAVAEMRGNGVTFMDLEFGDVKTENDIATLEVEGKVYTGAWFQDSEGNILSVGRES